MESTPKHIIKQDFLYPVSSIIASVLLVVGIFYFIEWTGGKIPDDLRTIVIGIIAVILGFHVLRRIFSWELTLYENSLEIKRPFGLMKNSRTEISYGEIEEIGFLQDFRMDTCLRIDVNSGKKYIVFLDKNLVNISKYLMFFENLGVNVGLYCDNRIKEKLKKINVKKA